MYPRTGGADQRDRILKVVRYAMILSVGWAVFITVMVAFAAPSLIALLSGSSESVVLENGVRYIRWNTPFYSVLGILLVLRNVLQGLGKKVVPLVSSMIEMVGKIAFVLLFIPILKYFGVIICEPVIWCLMCIQLVISYYRDPYIRGKEEKK